jgi:DNA-binding SARP family transcriptional activator
MDALGSASADPAETLHVTLFGGLGIALGERPIAVDAPRLRSLLAYLLLHRTSHPRERLAFLFWPDSDESQARTNLRQAFHLLRRALPEVDRFLDIDSRVVGLRGDAPWSVDVDEFERWVARARTARDADDAHEERSALEAAAAIYGGDLLPECYDEWVVPVRERLRDGFSSVVARLAELLELERDYRGAIPWARQSLDSDPVNEEACRRLMRLHALSGDRAGALRVYHGCATALVRELGVTPSAATEESYTRLLEPDAPAGPMEPEMAVTGSALVGRGEEWETLRSAWARAVDGESRLVVIMGEAGIGKSRLAEELRDWVRRQGFVSAISRCYLAAGGLAYAPVVELLRSPAFSPRLRRLEAPWLGELSRLMPELVTERPELYPTAPVIDDWQRARLLDALSHAVLAEARPMLLVIDDLQWCDRETLDWLNYVRSSKPQAPLLVVATARVEELGPDHPVHSLLRAARADARVTELELAPLRPDETALLAANVFGQDLGGEREERLHRETEGNPLFVVEWVRAGLIDEPLTPESDGQVPPIALSVMEARLAQLSPAGQELAGLAATVGREFTYDLLTRASSRSEEHVVDALDELWRRRIVRERGSLAYDFTHDKLREVAYRRASPARRRLLHRRVAQAIERLHGTSLDDVSGQLASHYEQAGWVERSIDFYARAAAIAQRVFANDETIDLLSRALELLPEESPGRARDVRELGLRTTLGVALVIRDGYGSPAVIETYTRAWESCERLGQPPTAPVLRGIGLSSLARGELRRAHELAAQLLELGVREDDPMIRVEGNYLLGVTSFWLGHLTDAREQLQRAIADYVPDRARSHLTMYSQDPRVICLSRLAYTVWHLGDTEEATARADEALQLAEQLEHPFSIGYVLTFASWLAIDMGDERRARELSERLAGLADERQLGFLQPLGTILRGWRNVVDGDTTEGIAMVREGIDLYRRSGQSLYLPWSLRLLAEMCADEGLLDAAQAALTEAFEVIDATEQRFLEADLLRLSGELVLADGGGRAEAESLFTQALAVSQRQGAVSLERRAAASLARLQAAGS